MNTTRGLGGAVPLLLASAIGLSARGVPAAQDAAEARGSSQVAAKAPRCAPAPRASSDHGYVRLVHAFGADGDDGRRPADGLASGPDGALYGATTGGGAHGFGRLFRLSPDGHATALHDFAGRPGDGADPEAAPTPDGAGGLLGTTHLGGAHGLGSIYYLDATGRMRLLHSFAGTADDGANPQAPLLRAGDGSFYGTTRGGGAHGAGMLFRITPEGAYEALGSFGGDDAALSDPLGALVQAGDGRILGVASAGGRHGGGGVFAYRARDPAPRTLVSMGAGNGCSMPMAGLARAADGRLLGTAYAGGPDNAGCVFSTSADGDYRVLYALRGAGDGAQPLSLPLYMPDGSLLLTSSLGSTHGDGALLRLDDDGRAACVLHAFGRADVSVPSGPLLAGAGGLLYGTAPYGGTHDEGGVFQVRVGSAPGGATPPALDGLAGPQGPAPHQWPKK